MENERTLYAQNRNGLWKTTHILTKETAQTLKKKYETIDWTEWVVIPHYVGVVPYSHDNKLKSKL